MDDNGIKCIEGLMCAEYSMFTVIKGAWDKFSSDNS